MTYKVNQIAIFLILSLSSTCLYAQPTQEFPNEYFGCRETSAAVPVGTDHFIVGNDEDNVLRVYSRTQAKPVAEHGFDLKLVPKAEHDEKKRKVDIEAATRIGKNLSLWLGSHSRTTEKHKRRKNRFRLFAVQINDKDPKQLKFMGYYDKLLHDILQCDSAWKLGLNKAFGPIDKKKHDLGPKDPGGFNMEGMSVIAKSKSVFLGLRNPLTQTKKPMAIILTLKNPIELTTKHAKKAKFGTPIFLDLNGLSIRSIEYWAKKKVYLIIAGHFSRAKDHGFQLYAWSGKPKAKAKLIKIPEQRRSINVPEALLIYPQNDHIQLLSDHGKEPKDSDGSDKYIHFESKWMDGKKIKLD